MNWSALVNGFKQIWENKPGIILLLGLAVVVFVFLVIDTRRHRKRHKRRHLTKY